MAGVARAAGYPDYSSSGVNKFNPEIWSGKLVANLYETTLFGKIANTDYEGEIKALGDTVIIRTVPAITINDYQIGGNLTYEKPESPAVKLNIDKAKSFSFECNDIDKHQSDIQLMNEWSDDGSNRMRIAIDKEILGSAYTSAHANNAGVNAGKVSSSYNLGAVGGNSVQLTKANVVDFLVDIGSVMDEQDLPDEDRWIALPTWVCGLIKKSDLKDASLAGDEKSMLRTGLLGSVDRLNIFRSNSISSAADGASTVFNLMAGHKCGLTFASQMTEMETLKNPSDFGSLVRGLNVFGFEVIKPQAIVHAVVRR